MFELLTMIVGLGGPTTFFLYCLYLVAKPSNKKQYSNKPLSTKANEVFT